MQHIRHNLTNVAFIAQSVQTIAELKHAVVGGEVGEDGTESIRQLNSFTYAVNNHTRVEPNSEGATGANTRATTIGQNHLLRNSATIIS